MLQEAFGDRVKVETLLPANTDPHNVSLNMSQRKLLQDAPLLVWLGEEFEPYLSKPTMAMPAQRHLNIGESKAIQWLELSDHDHHSHSNKDVHFWMNPQNAAEVITMVAQRLGEQYPAQKSGLDQAVSDASALFKTLDKNLMQQLAALKSKPFIVYHDAYQYLVEQYGLQQLDAVNFVPQQRLSASKMAALSKVAPRANCLVAEQPGNGVSQLAKQLNLPLTYVDPVASSRSIITYSQFMRSVAESFVACGKTD